MSENKQYQFYVVLLNICLTFSMRSHLLNFHAEYSKHMYVYIDIIDVISVKSDIINDVIAHTLLLMGALSREDRKRSFVFVLSSSCRTA